MPSIFWTSTGLTCGSRPLIERKGMLAKLVKVSKKASVQYSGHIDAEDGASLFEQALQGRA